MSGGGFTASSTDHFHENKYVPRKYRTQMYFLCRILARAILG